MDKRYKCLGRANRIRVRMPLGRTRSAWDCRPFGLGRIVAPIADGEIEVARAVFLNLNTGALRTEATPERRSA